MSGIDCGNSEDLLATLELVERDLEKCQITQQAIETELDRLRQERKRIFADLDRATTPSNNGETKVGSQWMSRRFGYSIDRYVVVVKQVWECYPDRRNAIIAALKKVGRRRSYIADDPQKLFTGWSRWKAVQHSREFADGWFIDTNLSDEQKNRLLAIILDAAGSPPV